MMKISPLILFVLVSYVAYTHGWTSDDQMKDNAELLLRDVLSVFTKRKITVKDVNRSISFSNDIIDRLATHEKILGYAGVEAMRETPTYLEYIDSFPEPETVLVMKDSLIAVSASAQLVYEFCDTGKLLKDDCGRMLKFFKLWKTSIGKSCSRLSKRCTKEEIYSKYRSFDGSCNHGSKNEAGQSFTVYGRLLNPNYLFGVKEPRRSVTKEAMESPRSISNGLYLDSTMDQKRSLAVLYWGQFVEHDLSHTAMSRMLETRKPIQCCSQDGRINSPRYIHPFCLPIRVPTKDKYYSKKDVNCLSYVRSLPGIGPDCAMGPMEQINQATHFLDASHIYGPTEEKSMELRSTRGKISVSHLGNATFLPMSSNRMEDARETYGSVQCFKSGDKRVNANPFITSLYTLWVREHNRIASKLEELNPDWDDETIFQEARRIVIAEIQHITYSEWIPNVLGKEINTKYSAEGNPTVSNSFATAAIRALQIVGSGKLSLLQEESILISERKKAIGDIFDDMVAEEFRGRGLGFVGVANNITYGLDLLSLDIQRGRDHGIPVYNEFREMCGENKVDSFDDLSGIMPTKTLESLKIHYRSVQDIDLIVGGLAEKPKKGLLGPTLSCILSEQFDRTKMADRYFYTNAQQPMPFSESQLEEIKKVTLARIICDNEHNMMFIQPKVFETKGDTNKPTLCNSEAIPSLNLGLWNNKRYTYS